LKKFVLIICLVIIALGTWAQVFRDPKCITLMDVPLEGPDSAFIPALESIGFQQTVSEDDEPDTYYFTGDY
jgi:hypothetical protein